MRDAARPEIDGATLDRFFERQRSEILARIRAAEAARRRPGPRLALAASALLAALLGAGVLGGGPAEEDTLAGLSLWTLDAYVATGSEDPLRHYGEWSETDAGANGPLAAFRVPDEDAADADTGDSLMDIPFDWTIDTPEADPASRG